MQVQHKLEVKRRERTGSRYAKREREAGYLPAVLYGQGRPPVSLLLNHKEAVKFFHSGERVFDVEVKGENVTQTVMLTDVQFDYLGTEVIHCDLTRVDLDQEVESAVQVELRGEPEGMKEEGAVMQQMQTSVTVRCSVRALPDGIEADVSGMGVGEPLHAGDLPLPAGVELADDPETVIAVISVKAEPVETGEGEEVGEEPSAPEVIGESEREEGSGEAEEEG